ncbi:MAG: DoxX family protein [Ectothiorhodospiraceae bacterium]|nr:DoxX family protein [Ectothiorhodospiraceae bacterium]
MLIEDKYSPVAIAALRIALGTMFIAHSLYLKYFVFTLQGNAQFFESVGLPSSFSYFIFGIEVIGGIMLVLGLQARWVALALSPVLAGATWAHWGNGWMFGYENGGWEYPLYLTLLALCQFALGDGRYALSPSKGFTPARVN